VFTLISPVAACIISVLQTLPPTSTKRSTSKSRVKSIYKRFFYDNIILSQNKQQYILIPIKT